MGRYWTDADLVAWEEKRPHTEYIPPREHKYGAKSETVDGIKFASKWEAEVYQRLKIQKEVGFIKELTLQPRFKMPPGFTYVADFDVEFADGTREIIDAKGYPTADFKLKEKCFRYFYPDIKLTILRRDGK